MIRSFLNIYAADIGVKPDNVLSAIVGLEPAKYPTEEAQISFYDQLKRRLQSLPGVEAVAVANRAPVSGSIQLPYELAGNPPTDPERLPKISALVISADYFRTLGAAVLSGRDFTEFDGGSGLPVVLVNQRFVSQYWPGEDPIGKRLRVFQGNTPEAWR